MNGDVFLRKFYEKPSSFREIVVGSHHNYGNKVFMRSINKDDSLKEITFSQFYEDNINFGTGLFSLGLKEKRFAVISETRYEWLEAYLAAIMGGGIIVPLDKELNIIGETLFPDNVFVPELLFITDKGLYISTNNERNPDFDEDFLKFERIELKEF